MASLSRRKQSKPRRLDDAEGPLLIHAEPQTGATEACGCCGVTLGSLADVVAHRESGCSVPGAPDSPQEEGLDLRAGRVGDSELLHLRLLQQLCAAPPASLLSPPSSNEAGPCLRCPLCQEPQKSLGALDWHSSQSHAGARLLRCACGGRFASRPALAAHARAHSLAVRLRDGRPKSTERPASTGPDGRASCPAFEMAEAATSPPSPAYSDISRPGTPSLGHFPRPLDLSASGLDSWGDGGVFGLPPLGFFSSAGQGLAFPPMELGEDDWESMMEVNQVDENEKIRQLVGDKPQPPVTDPNQCLICRRILSCKSALQMHYRTHTGERPFKCKICLRAFTTKGNLKTHMGVHRSKHPFRLQHQCPICQKRFLNSALLHQHVRLHTTQLHAYPPPPPPPPPVSQADVFAAQPSPDLPPLPFRAPPEPKEESPVPVIKEEPLEAPQSSPSLLFGPTSLMAPNPFAFGLQPPPTSTTPRPSTTCNICCKTFACYSALEIHYRSHTGDKPFVCPQCGRGFSTRGNMKQHLMTHKIRDAAAAAAASEASSTPKSCSPSMSECGSRLSTTPSGLSTSGLFAATGSCGAAYDRPLKEEPKAPSSSGGTPPTSFPGPSPLDSIKAMWAQTEPPAPRRQPTLSRHQCGVCFKHFSSSSALQIHMRTHTGDKPFKCNCCGRAFTTKGNLKVHMGTHMWNNPSRRGRRIFDFPLGGEEDGENESEGPSSTEPPASSAGLGFPFPSPALFASSPLFGAPSGLTNFRPPVLSGAPLASAPPPPSLFGPKGAAPVEAMLWMWRNVCSVCQKVCESSSELEEHLKLHLSAGPALSAAPSGLMQQ